MRPLEARYGVWLHQTRVGTLNQRGDFTWFTLDGEYIADSERAVLGLIFEQDLHARHASAMRMPPWFSNLLPEGKLRDWIAVDRGVSVEREMELLAHVGHDLPGAVQILLEDQPPEAFDPAPENDPATDESGEDVGWRFSLAGVGLKFSMLAREDRLTVPAHGQWGDWIVKLPDAQYANVPINENAMMTLAGLAGIEVPRHMLVHRNDLVSLPEDVWQGSEEIAYAVKRFDRRSDGSRVHIEDFAQARNFLPDWKYRGTFETVGAYCYRGHDLEALKEFVRRVTFNILVSNGDAHLKNWSMIYRDPRVPTLSPVYDLVSTALYAAEPTSSEDLGLKLGKSRRFEVQRVDVFRRLGDRVGADGRVLTRLARETVDRVTSEWPNVMALLDSAPQVQEAVDESIRIRSASLLLGKE